MGKKSYYIEVLPVGVKIDKPLTYQVARSLAVGQMVKVPYGNKSVFGLVESLVSKPNFPTKMVDEVLELPPLPRYTPKLARWIATYYATHLSDASRLFIPPRPDINSRFTSAQVTKKSKNISLNAPQRSVINQINNGNGKAWLLHGVTGSGKTAVYMELCRTQLMRGKSSIVLVPEIALATQVIAEFRQEFGEDIVITHSKMSEAQRRSTWRHILAAEKPMIVIGPRSALFSPLKHIGLIVMDESHETSYKQEQTPHYHARDVAARLASLTRSKLVLGSATPSTHEMFLVEEGRLKLVALPEPIHKNTRTTEVVDMRKHGGSIISPQLTRLLHQALEEKRQSLLFLNRRGSASQVLCSECGEVQTCSKCEIPQTWHGDSGRLRCHWCGTSAKLPTRCVNCKQTKWRFLGMGTKKVEAEVKKLLPHAKVHRLDKDSFSEDTIAQTIQDLKQGKIDILIGTQMIAKGLDIPGVKVVGVVLADTLLHIPDIYSNERTYQLLHQVIGRSGRSDQSDSSVVIQTYSVDHPSIVLASNQDFDTFIKGELHDRKQFLQPPYRHALKLSCKRKTAKGAQNASIKLAEKLKKSHRNIHILGPAPAWREQLNGQWYWNIIITSPTRDTLRQIVARLPANWRADLDPSDFL